MKLMIIRSLSVLLFLSMTVGLMGGGTSGVSAAEPFVIAATSQSGITEDQAAVIVSKMTGGRIISSETRGTKGVTVYKFKVLMSDGQVKIIRVKASSGAIF